MFFDENRDFEWNSIKVLIHVNKINKNSSAGKERFFASGSALELIHESLEVEAKGRGTEGFPVSPAWVRFPALTRPSANAPSGHASDRNSYGARKPDIIDWEGSVSEAKGREGKGFPVPRSRSEGVTGKDIGSRVIGVTGKERFKVRSGNRP